MHQYLPVWPNRSSPFCTFDIFCNPPLGTQLKCTRCIPCITNRFDLVTFDGSIVPEDNGGIMTVLMQWTDFQNHDFHIFRYTEQMSKHMLKMGMACVRFPPTKRWKLISPHFKCIFFATTITYRTITLPTRIDECELWIAHSRDRFKNHSHRPLPGGEKWHMMRLYHPRTTCHDRAHIIDPSKANPPTTKSIPPQT